MLIVESRRVDPPVWKLLLAILTTPEAAAKIGCVFFELACVASLVGHHEASGERHERIPIYQSLGGWICLMKNLVYSIYLNAS